MTVKGQVVIGGNVYGGGNKGNVDGSTKVTVKRGDINKVFGGARMANVGGNAYVNIDGVNAFGYILINYLYGGNDIAGTIGTAAAVGEALPAELTGNPDHVDDSWNTYVHISDNAAHTQKTFIGQLFAGGNGDYNYTDDEGKPLMEGEQYVVKEGDNIIAYSNTEFRKPELDKAYLDVQGGTIVYAYGGGNNVTVTDQAVIHVDNPSTVVTELKLDADGLESESGTNVLEDHGDRLRNQMGIKTAQEHVDSPDFQMGRLFGGNNKADMAIMPSWNLQSGKVRNLYSGGNRGRMTSPKGILLEIDPKVPDGLTYDDAQAIKKKLVIDNVYGGCRMADVFPSINGVYTTVPNLDGYKFPTELSARVLVRGGDINNVYGGNDVTGTVYGGNAVGVYTSIRGDIYGGGNGAYAYTNMETYKDDEEYGDYYYTGTTGGVADLNLFRPNAEQVSIRLKGEENHPTIIQGSVYVGGNCASLDTKKSKPMVELKIGSYVWADKVFLGNNGEKMVDPDILKLYANKEKPNFSTLDLTNTNVFADYMEGVAMDLLPEIKFDNVANGDPDTYIGNSSKIGSFFCGGNVGSMSIGGDNTYTIDQELIIFDKFVAGCNNADVAAGENNASYQGGVLGTASERKESWSLGDADQFTDYYEEVGGKKVMKDRIQVDLVNLTIEPRRWDDEFTFVVDADLNEGKLKAGEEYYKTPLRSTRFIAKGTEVVGSDTYYKLEKDKRGKNLLWNTVKWDTTENEFVPITSDNTAEDGYRRLIGGNIYGGCYNSGHVNGNVIININQDLVKRDVIFAETDGIDPYTIKDGGERRSGVLLEAQGDDVQAMSMTVFGAGHGAGTEIWGSTTINHTKGYAFQIFGGGEEGVVGKKFKTSSTESGDYVYHPAYSSTVNLKGPNAGYSEKETGKPLAEAEYIYGGGNEGDVIGDTYVYLGNGRVYDAFGGACNADILGHTELYVGYNGGFPWVRDNVYGGNDFGGIIKGHYDHIGKVRQFNEKPLVFEELLAESSTYVKYIQGHVGSIFGGGYGNYDYTDRVYKDYTDSDGKPLVVDGEPEFSYPHLIDNSFVHFQPVENDNNIVSLIFGGSEGYPGNMAMNNAMQHESYVLIDDTQTTDAHRYANMDVFGGGSYAGVGMSTALGAGRAVVDLYAGNLHNAYGGCKQEGLVGFTRVNVPAESTVKVNAIFGGGRGYDLSEIENQPELGTRTCDHYVTCVDYKGTNAIVNDAIYGGNQSCRIACDTYINIEAPVNQGKGYQATIYGGGYGAETVSGRTNVFMNAGSNAYKVFGGGRDGNAFNFASLKRWLYNQYAVNHPVTYPENATAQDKEAAAAAANTATLADVTAYGGILKNFGDYISEHKIRLPNTIGTYPNDEGIYDGTYTNDIMPTEEKPMPDYHQTNVHIMQGGNVSGYAYGGGYGSDAVVGGTTLVELLGGNVDRDIYGGGQGGPVYDEFGLSKDNDATNDFVATTNVYIEGGMARNVYGGGYLGHVGKHVGDISTPYADDIPGVANVVIGKTDGSSFYDGVPAILRNVYGGGEGGSVYGTTNVTIHNGYVGYRCQITGTEESPEYEYVEELDDQNPNDIVLAGNVFGGGYVVNSYVDIANVNMYGGLLRGSLYGGGEVGPIGRGTVRYKNTGTTGRVNNDARIFKAGQTHIKMYNGQVLRNVFGGGRGKDSWGGDGTKFMHDNMSDDEFDALDLQCKGYVFGQTEVNIYGGEVGSDEGMLYGYGNVFGGGDEGSVYSAYEDGNGNLCIGKKSGKRYNEGLESTDPEYNYQGYYYKWNDDFLTNGDERIFTEDCKVLVEPWLQVKRNPITYGEKKYEVGDYIPTEYLNTLGAKTVSGWPSAWSNLDVGEETDDGFKERGVIIHNAVFAGGNIASGSSAMYANEKTVFGNATASIHDLYNRDFITIGTGHTGGLYGDGNLTFVDGYRELNITNYGTDYYHIARTLDYDSYKLLPKREKDYYEVKYKCLVECTDNEGTTYKPGTDMPQDELMVLFTKSDGTSVQDNGVNIIILDESGQKVLNPTYWKENGVVSTYAGRIMNTIQRADFCGVFGSRMVMKGAQDRVPEVVDYTNYTINRVREVSLNKMTKSNELVSENQLHGNYFGIYSIVNYLGALTSDVDFHSVRTTKSDNSELAADGTTTFCQWKNTHISDRKRNNGNCHNQVALASGVYLELTTEKNEGKGNGLYDKDWGYITGVIELDLINVQAGIGGGFVYAKNEHGDRSPSGINTTTLTALNKKAVTQWDFNYATSDDAKTEWQSSGNFIHSSQTIIDDCYNESGRYKTGGVPAHYWYISGQVYVYDQYISAYTGSPNAYSKNVEIPITINAASNGTMTLMDVQPNLYAYYSTYNISTSSGTKLDEDQKLVVNNVTYQLNDPISYWDWNKLPTSEKYLFVKDTYVVSDSCKIGSSFYPPGYVMLPAEYATLQTAAEATKHVVDSEEGAEAVPAVLKASKDQDGNEIVVVDKEGHDVYEAFTSVFHSSNNLSHDKGYLLTYQMTNPLVWDKWYTQVVDGKDAENNDVLVKNQTGGTGFEDGPTFYPDEDGLYGQQSYKEKNIISKKVYDDYQKAVTDHSLSLANQATFERAHLVVNEYLSSSQHLYPGAAVSSEISGYTQPAYVCTSTIKLSDSKFIYVNELMTATQKQTYIDQNPTLADDIDEAVVEAYICMNKGLYGGNYYLSNQNYRALEAWSSMSEADRKNFNFNYDALDLLVDSLYGTDPTYGNHVGGRYQYDGWQFTTENKARENAATYSLKTPIDYKATYNGTTDKVAHNGIKRTNGVEYSRTDYEKLPNEQRHYSPILVTAAGNVYVVNKDFVHIETPYAAGTIISEESYDYLTQSEKENVTVLTFSDSDFSGDGTTYYYCREEYTIGEKTEGVEPTPINDKISGSTGGIVDGKVKVGTIIPATTTTTETGTVRGYSDLPNYQKNFTIHGVSPMETSTLYVGRNANIKDLSTEKIITVIYKYDYEESDGEGMHITPVSERHVVNIHITFKSGVPIIEDINEPSIVLPGYNITLRTPNTTPGAYDILGGGWELFEKPDDAESHTNGTEYDMANNEPLYWYQDGFYLAYYAKTYLGKTYSNHVPVHVANYHDLKKVVEDPTHLHVDYDRTRLKRDSKIYINDYSGSSQNGLDLFKSFYDLSVGTPSDDYTPLNISTEPGTNIHDGKTYQKGVRAGKNLEFFLRTDIEHPNPWTSIGGNDCFAGKLHGDGHHLSGLSSSLFSSLCGDVYNLGVSGTFTGAGIAESGSGYVENCWVSTPSPADGSRPVFGTPARTTEEKAELGSVQIVNCYYEEDDNAAKKYTNHDVDSEYGTPTRKTSQAFYNGEVAYDLNGFYLWKRYNDQKTSSGTSYQYYTVGSDNQLTLQPAQYYESDPTLCSSGYKGIQYVEDRFADGDFRYASGNTVSDNERRFVDTEHQNKEYFFPIWPDDYLFFGQKLTYGHASDEKPHQDVPTAIARDGSGRLSMNSDANRVYRAPAYYRSKTRSVIHFNPEAYLAAYSADGTKDAYPNLTAIDFAGHEEGHAADAYLSGMDNNRFYPPLLDDDGLLSVINKGETKNLLVYAPAASSDDGGYVNEKTYDVLSGYFVDPVYNNFYDNSQGYRRVASALDDISYSSIYGHLVQSDLTITNDHLLVDYQDFNAPIPYRSDGSHRVWYQRLPEDREYVDLTKGWQGISLPFTAELVSTSDKGEITHFYSGSATASQSSTAKIGHEYWLRKFNDITHETVSENEVVKADFTYPSAGEGDSMNKTGEDAVTNTFLWDYYYQNVSVHNQKDANDDTYQTYYKTPRSYTNYPLLTAATPYILGLPGKTYYEFDLSGNFKPQHTAYDQGFAGLDKQVITFASGTDFRIGVSEDEMENGVFKSYHSRKYTFRPSYMNMSIEAGSDAFTLNSDGNSFVKVPSTGDATSVSAFRPYFTSGPSETRAIIFGNEQSEQKGGEEHGDPRQDDGTGTLTIYAKNGKIFVESSLNFTEDVRIVTPAGITVSTFAVKPGQTVEVRADASGMYIVHTLDGQYTKKVAVNRAYMLSM